MTFDLSDGDGDETLTDPLAKDVDQQGARFNSGRAPPDVRADAARLRDPRRDGRR